MVYTCVMLILLSLIWFTNRWPSCVECSWCILAAVNMGTIREESLEIDLKSLAYIQYSILIHLLW